MATEPGRSGEHGRLLSDPGSSWDPSPRPLPPPRRRSRFALRLRHKLGISLVIAALLPVVVASWVAVSVVLRALNSGLHDETDRQLHVGLNLLLRNVERVGQEAVRLSGSDDLVAAIGQGPVATSEVLVDESGNLPASLVQIADASGTVQAQRVVGGAAGRVEDLEVDSHSAAIEAGRKYERRVTIVPVGDRLVVRAVAPVVDASLDLRGVVVVSVPLDGAFADGLKASLGTDVLIFAGDAAASATSTFVDPIGGRVGGVQVDDVAAEQIRRGRSVFRRATILDHEYAIGYAPIFSLAGDIVGVFAVAVDRAALLSARAAATRSLALGAAGAFVFALGLAGLLSRRITRPIAHLHQGAAAIARGDLDHEIEVSEGDEMGDLAAAFSQMTASLKENQRRLAARMREIVALHDAGRAVSSVLDLDHVLRKIVDSVARVLHVRVCGLWLVEPGRPDLDLRLGAARAKRSDMRIITRTDEAAQMVQPLARIAADVARSRTPLRINQVADDEPYREAAVAAGVTGSLVACPLERKGNVLGVVIIGRARDARPYSEADSNLLATFADQAAAAIENARLFAEVRQFNEELEAKVRLRTQELVEINSELGRTIGELRDTQAQLILSERLAGLGQLVAGVAHEINSPTAAIRGTIDALAASMARLGELARQVAELELPSAARDDLDAWMAERVPTLAGQRLAPPAAVRRTAGRLRAELEGRGLPAEAAGQVARQLAELGMSDVDLAGAVDRVVGAGAEPRRALVLSSYVSEQVHLHRSARTIDGAIRRIQRIVGGLKSYSHLDQEAAPKEADLHEGIENTLVLLDHLLARGITVTRRYGDLPKVLVYVDELNQVWTNLLHNAVQALEGDGEIAIETLVEDASAVVRIIDGGPGIAADVLPRIFEPFFTTKPRGQGSGLGLGIVRRIVDRHGGEIRVDSAPGRTVFEVRLPLAGPPAPAAAGESVGEPS